ncbi:MAG: TolC family protein [Candidatus Cloacimonetes bacterium]|nr:TolC family protein [Candidatus Cloacimonadota bacterium]
MKIIFITLLLMVILTLNAELSLQEAKQIALQNNPELLSVESSLKSAILDKYSSYLTFIPSSTLSGSYQESRKFFEFEEYAGSYSLSISQPVFMGGKIWYGHKTKRNNESIARETFNLQIQTTLSGVETRFFAVLEAQDALESSQKDLKSTETNLQSAELRFSTGTISNTELLRFKSELASKQVSVLQRETAYNTALNELENYLQTSIENGISEIEPDQYKELTDFLQGIDDSDTDRLIRLLSEEATENNSSLKISDLNRRNSVNSKKISVGEFLPTVSLSYSKRWNYYDLQSDNQNEGISLNFSMPIFPLADKALSVGKAHQVVKKTEYQHKSTSDNILLSIKKNFLTLITSAKMMESAALALEFAEETYQQTQVKFNTGMVTANDLLNVEVTLISARNQFTTSFYNFLRAKSALMQQLGYTDDIQLADILSK